jgi:TorA maturation chaperone TorD
MTLQVENNYSNQLLQDTVEDSTHIDVSTIDEEQHYRASAYSLIGSLLRSPPDEDLLQHVSGLTQNTPVEGDDLLLSMSALGLSAKLVTPEAIEDEFHTLFIGIGKGEVVPYGSWYLTGFLMEKPLSDLRDALSALGYQKNEDICEPEDHAAALCEVMSMMILEGKDFETQKAFFDAHMSSWMGRFYTDLSTAKSALFYKAMGRFGSAFLMLENEYFSMQT